MRNVWMIIKKELTRFFTDKRMLISIFLPGVLIYFLYSFMGSAMSDATISDAKHKKPFFIF